MIESIHHDLFDLNKHLERISNEVKSYLSDDLVSPYNLSKSSIQSHIDEKKRRRKTLAKCQTEAVNKSFIEIRTKEYVLIEIVFTLTHSSFH